MAGVVSLDVIARVSSPAWPEGLVARTGEGVGSRVVAECFLVEDAIAHGRAAHRLGHIGRDPSRLAGLDVLDVLDLEATPVGDDFDLLDPERLHGRLRRGSQQSHVDHLAVDLLLDDQLVRCVDGELHVGAHAHLGHPRHGPTVGIGERDLLLASAVQLLQQRPVALARASDRRDPLGPPEVLMAGASADLVAFVGPWRGVPRAGDPLAEALVRQCLDMVPENVRSAQVMAVDQGG